MTSELCVPCIYRVEATCVVLCFPASTTVPLLTPGAHRSQINIMNIDQPYNGGSSFGWTLIDPNLDSPTSLHLMIHNAIVDLEKRQVDLRQLPPSFPVEIEFIRVRTLSTPAPCRQPTADSRQPTERLWSEHG